MPPAGHHPPGSGPDTLPGPVTDYISSLVAAVQIPSRVQHLPEHFETLWADMELAERSCLVRSPSLWRALLNTLGPFDSLFDVRAVVMAQLALDAEARQQASASGFTSALAEALVARALICKNDKQLEHVSSTATTLALLALDAPPAANAPWVLQMTLRTTEAIETAQRTQNNQYEAFSLVTAFIKLLYMSTDTPLCALVASTFVDHSGGGLSLCYRVSKALLKPELKGIPKIIAEKCLLLLSKMYTESPDFVPAQLSAIKLGKLLTIIARDCSWVHARDISLVFLARLLFDRRALPLTFLDQPEVLNMLQTLLAIKSIALRMTAVAFVSFCPPATFHLLANQFASAIDGVDAVSFRGLKMAMHEAGRGVWSLPVGLSAPAVNAFVNSSFLADIVAKVPMVVPRILWPILPEDVQTGVAIACGVNDYDIEQERKNMRPPIIGGPAVVPPMGATAFVANVAPSHVQAAPQPAQRSNAGDLGQRRASTSASGGPRAPQQPASKGVALRPPAWESSGAGTAPPPSGPSTRATAAAAVAPGGARATRASAGSRALGRSSGGGGGSSGGGAPPAAPKSGKPAAPARKHLLVDVTHDDDDLFDVPLTSATSNGHAAKRAKSHLLATSQAHMVARGTAGAPWPGAPSPATAAAHAPPYRTSSGGSVGATQGPFSPTGDELASGPWPQRSQQGVGGGAGAGGAAPQVRPGLPRLPMPIATAAAAQAQPAQPQPANGGAAQPPGVAPPQPQPQPAVAPDAPGIAALNATVDLLYVKHRGSSDEGMQKLLKNLAVGAANITVVQLKCGDARLAQEVPAGRLDTLRSRAELVCSGVAANESLHMLLPFSELLVAESGQLRSAVEAAERSAAPAAGGPAPLSTYRGGENIFFALSGT